MPPLQETIANRLNEAPPLVRTEIIAQQATSPAAETRAAIGRALAGHVHELGAQTAIEHLSRDQNVDVRAAAIKTATTAVDECISYPKILQKASNDPSARIRRIALLGLLRNGLVADPDKLNAPVASAGSDRGRCMRMLFPERSRRNR